MKNFPRKNSSAYLNNIQYNNTNEDDDYIYENISLLSTKKKRITDFFCSLINTFSLIITSLYNIFWIYTFHQILPKIEEEQAKNCLDIFNWNQYYYIWVIISLTKAVFFLLCAQLSTGTEFDCNFFCLIMKILSSLIPCIMFVIKLPYYGPNSYTREADTGCFELYENLSFFYRYETYYLIFIVCLAISPILGAVAMAIKEYIKCLGEKND